MARETREEMVMKIPLAQVQCKTAFFAVMVLCALRGFGQMPNSAVVQVAPETFANAMVKCFLKDSRGYMWFGTADGLVRYDGTNSCRYEHDPENKYSLSHNTINTIVEDTQQRMWVGTAWGLCIYNREKDYFINVDSLNGKDIHLNNRYVTSLLPDSNDRLWIGTHGGGINIYNPKTRSYTYLLDKDDGNTNYINTLLLVDDLIWCGTRGGLELFNAINASPLPLTFVEQKLPPAQIARLASDRIGNVWLSTVNGEIIKINSGNGYYSFKTIVSGHIQYGASWSNILAFCFDKKDNLWIAGENSGLNYLETKSSKVTRYLAENANAITPSNSIQSIYVDDVGSTWIGTINKGAYLIDSNAKTFTTYQWGKHNKGDFEGNEVRGFAEDQEGNIWIALDGGGLHRFNAKTQQLTAFDLVNQKLSNKFLTAIVSDRHNNLWLGTRGNGVYKIDMRKNGVFNYPVRSDGFGDDKIDCLYEDKEGTIWAGTAGSGLFYFDQLSQSFTVLCEEKNVEFIKKTAYINCLLEDTDKTLWVGTMYGLYALKKKDGYAFDYHCYLGDDQPGSISSTRIQSLYEDKRKNLWVGTPDNGLNVKFKGISTFKLYQRKHGLSSNTIRSIVADSRGNIWVGGNSGLSKLDKGQDRIINFTREDGLVSNDFKPNAVLRTSGGTLLFGSNNGFNVFNPDSIRTNLTKPVVYLTDLKINNQSAKIGAVDSPLRKHISLTSSLDLSYEQRSFTIDFIAINYGQSVRHAYCYMLKGFDKDWNCTGSNTSAPYTNIDPGHYVFLVKGANSDGIWSDAPVKLEINIRPLMWKTWWAKLIYLLILTSIIYSIFRIRLERLTMRNQLEFERLAREREHELTESKTQFFTNISHELRTPLSLILMPLEGLMNEHDASPAVKERVSTAYKNADKMMRLVNELMDFNKLENTTLRLNLHHGEIDKFITNVASHFQELSLKKNIAFTIKCGEPSITGWFDRDKLEKIVFNILSNAFKFTSERGAIHMFLTVKELSLTGQDILSRYLEFVVVDNGIGISPEELPRIFDKFYQAKSAAEIPNPGTGIGLSLTKSLVELHLGSITAESSPDSETKFIIMLPIDAHVYGVETEVKTSEDAVHVKAQVQQVTADDPTENLSEGVKDKPEILIVEDNDELRQYLTAELSYEFIIYEAKDGQEGLQLAFEKSPDLIISDIRMSNKTGLDLCKAVKTDVKTSHIPFIMLTAKASVDDQIAGIETGADIYITKPFSIRILLTHVRNIIDTRQKLYSQFSHDVYLLPSKLAATDIDQAFIQKVIDYINDNIQDAQLGVDSIAEVFNLSRVQVYRKVKALTGKTAVEFIRTVRLKHALKLMETRKFTLSEIAFQTGFNSASYFTRSFKDEYGKAPSEYLNVNS